MRVFARSLVSPFLSSHGIFAGEWMPHFLVYPLGRGRVRETLDVCNKEHKVPTLLETRERTEVATLRHTGGQRRPPPGEKVEMPCFEKWRRVNCPSWWTGKAWCLW